MAAQQAQTKAVAFMDKVKFFAEGHLKVRIRSADECWRDVPAHGGPHTHWSTAPRTSGYNGPPVTNIVRAHAFVRCLLPERPARSTACTVTDATHNNTFPGTGKHTVRWAQAVNPVVDLRTRSAFSSLCVHNSPSTREVSVTPVLCR